LKRPTPAIGTLSDIFGEYYTHAEIDLLFLQSDAPEEYFDGNKGAKVQHRQKMTNQKSLAPLEVLGVFIEDFMERDPKGASKNGLLGSDTPTEWEEKFAKNQLWLREKLSKSGLTYHIGGLLSTSFASPTLSLRQFVTANGLTAVQTEIDRALKLVNDDPNGAAQFAANVLVAVFKSYLTKKSIWFDEDADTLNGLWAKVRDSLGLNPKDMVAKDLQKIASGLNSIVDGTMFMRNERSGAHGKSEEQANKARIRPRHARLVIHSSHTLAAYVLECMEDL
jgi:hypothetical protein